MPNTEEKTNIGAIAAVNGPVIDVRFAPDALPKLRDALTVRVGKETRVMEVAQHIGGAVVRCIMLGASEGLCRDMPVTATGSPIAVPVGDAVFDY